MNMTLSNPGGFAVLIVIGTSVFWMYVGWRAMLAHERLAKAAEDMARKMREREHQPT
jgi:uncharacterized membrane protein